MFLISIWLCVLALGPQGVCAAAPPCRTAPPPPPCPVEVGADRLFSPGYIHLVQGKRIGLLTNQTGVTHTLERTLDIFERWHAAKRLTLAAVFVPEHGLTGEIHAGRPVASGVTEHGVPVHSLFGATRRPTKEMLRGVDALVYDIQDIGSRSYTFASTLYYTMEAAAKEGIQVIVLDRPNPLGGRLVDGPMLEESFRSFVGYIDVPYCHGMTIGELARFFNGEYRIGCNLEVVPMHGWRRGMRFEETGLPWIPTSPNVPEPSTPCFYPATGILGEIGLVSIGGGYTLPFKIVAAPWIDRTALAKKLNHGSPPGVHFQEVSVRPVLGQHAGQSCGGVLVVVTNWAQYNPIHVQYWILDGLRQLYPDRVVQALQTMKKDRLSFFYQICGTRSIYEIVLKERAPFTSLTSVHKEKRNAFHSIRQKYLIASYGS